jgi:hypothetical protein
LLGIEAALGPNEVGVGEGDAFASAGADGVLKVDVDGGGEDGSDGVLWLVDG